MNTLTPKEIFEKYYPHFQHLNARIYSQQPGEDLLILKWWMNLHETGEINRLVLKEAHGLHDFMVIFKLPTALFYSLNAQDEIDNAMWLSPMDSSQTTPNAYCGVFCAEECRGKTKQALFTYLAYSIAFEVYHAVHGLTWQPEILEIHRKLGYDIVGCIPNLYDKPFIYYVRLSKEGMLNSRFAKIAEQKWRKVKWD